MADASTSPSALRLGQPLPPAALSTLRRRAIFECCKWDPQVEDVSTIAPMPLWLPRHEWAELSRLAAALHLETLAIERALLLDPGAAHAGELALPPALLRALAPASWLGRPGATPAADGPRVMRFDFHPTTEGWRVSEVNCDVPGGYVEASGVTALFAEAYGAKPTGDAAGALAGAVARSARASGGDVALVHATAYSDDRQVMEYLARRLRALDVVAHPCAPDALALVGSEAHLFGRRLGALVRFFPAEWLAELRSGPMVRALFRGLRTPATNPGAALLAQSKRLPLLWDALGVDVPTWRALLPETRDPRSIDASALAGDDWVLKPALGRVGADIALPGATPPKERAQITKEARRRPREWIAQRCFTTLPLSCEQGARYPCLGVFTLDGKAVGVYGRLSATPLVDHRAQDVAVLLPGQFQEQSPEQPQEEG